MSTGVKVILIIAALILLLVLAVAGFGFYWWTQYGQRMMEGAQTAQSDGREFGRSTDNAGCLNETLTRHRAHSGFSDAIANNLFLNGCLQASRPSAGFCDGVPRVEEVRATIEWHLERCRQANLQDSYCNQIFQQVQQYCERRSVNTNTNPPGARMSPSGK